MWDGEGGVERELRGAPGRGMKGRRAARISEGARFWVTASKEGPGVTLGKKRKKCMRFGALYCICYIKIISFENFKLLFFSQFLFERKYLQL